MFCGTGIRRLFAYIAAMATKDCDEKGTAQNKGRHGDVRKEWIWMTANHLGHEPVRLHLLRGRVVQWNDGAPHGRWRYDDKHDILYVRVHYNACEGKAKEHVFRTIPGSNARANVGQDAHFNVVLLPPSTDSSTDVRPLSDTARRDFFDVLS